MVGGSSGGKCGSAKKVAEEQEGRGKGRSGLGYTRCEAHEWEGKRLSSQGASLLRVASEGSAFQGKVVVLGGSHVWVVF